MTNYKNDLPLYAEEQIIQQKIKIPSNFIDVGQPKKYWGSTEGLDKSLCQRYNFKHNDKTIVLDISQKLIEKLGLNLKEKEIHSFGAYINKDLLKKTPEEGGITVDKEKDIICQTEGVILVQEKENQTDFTSGEITDLKQKLKKSEELSQETQKFLEIIAKDNEEKHIAIIFFEGQIKDLTQRITELRQDLENEILNKKRAENKCRELERIIKKLREDEQVLIGLQNRISDLQRELGDERLDRERSEQDLQTKILERDENLYIIQGWYGNEILEDWWKISLLTREINRLNGIIRLLEKLAESELNEKQGDIDDLTTRRDNLQTQLNKWTTQFSNENANQVQTRINSLNSQIATLNSQKLIPDEQNAITWTNLCLTAMNNALTYQQTSYLDSYQSYFNPNGVFYSTNHYKYGRMNTIVQNLYNTWNQTRTQINARNSLITNYQSQISSLNSQLTTANNTINQKDIQIASLNQQITNLDSELQKEKGWWDKWINDEKDFLCSTTVDDKFYLFIKWPQYSFSIFDFFIPGISNFNNITDILSFKEFKGSGLFFGREQHELNKGLLENSSRSFKEMIKRKVYQYYRDE